MEDNQPKVEIPTPEAPAEEVKHPVSPKLYELRKYFVYVLVGGLIISALVAIIAVLIGNMDGIIGKSLSTVVSVILHSLVALGFISMTSTKQPNKGSAIVINTLFGLTVLSLITSMLSTWDVVTDSEFIFRQYLAYFAAFVTSLIIYGLYQSTENDKSTVIARNTAIGSSLTSFVLLLPIIYKIDNLVEFYYRLLVAVNIVVAVSVVITVIFHWYYVSKQPKEDNEERTPLTLGQLIGRIVLWLIGLWFAAAFISAFINSFSGRLGY